MASQLLTKVPKEVTDETNRQTSHELDDTWKPSLTYLLAYATRIKQTGDEQDHRDTKKLLPHIAPSASLIGFALDFDKRTLLYRHAQDSGAEQRQGDPRSS